MSTLQRALWRLLAQLAMHHLSSLINQSRHRQQVNPPYSPQGVVLGHAALAPKSVGDLVNPPYTPRGVVLGHAALASKSVGDLKDFNSQDVALQCSPLLPQGRRAVSGEEWE
eukprot:4529764-Karenia_brevis.AAC.1